LAPARKHRHHRSHGRDSLDERLSFSRLAKRWAFPLIVILATIVAVAFTLGWRNQDNRPRIVVTPPR
jgi:lipopolysaccharide export LptBFGC system permease protein LptF